VDSSGRDAQSPPTQVAWLHGLRGVSCSSTRLEMPAGIRTDSWGLGSERGFVPKEVACPTAAELLAR
jgi:hypothetical protein